MDNQVTLKVAKREVTGKTAARQLRRDGFVPANLYGRDDPCQNLTVGHRELEALATRISVANTLVELEVEDPLEKLQDLLLARNVVTDDDALCVDQNKVRYAGAAAVREAGDRLVAAVRPEPVLGLALLDPRVLQLAGALARDAEHAEATIEVLLVELGKVPDLSPAGSSSGSEELEQPDLPPEGRGRRLLPVDIEPAVDLDLRHELT